VGLHRLGSIDHGTMPNDTSFLLCLGRIPTMSANRSAHCATVSNAVRLRASLLCWSAATTRESCAISGSVGHDLAHRRSRPAREARHPFPYLSFFIA